MLTPSARLAAAPLSPPPGWSAERLELHHGLLDRPAHIDPKFLYDALGSSLFAAITQLPEYYPTRCEAEIHAAHGAAIARHAGAVETLLDLGAGDCAKAERLFPVLRPRRYVPIDISTDYLEAAAPSAPGLSRAAGDAAGTGFLAGSVAARRHPVRPAPVLLSRLQHRQSQSRRRAGHVAACARTLSGRRPADRRGSRQAARGAGAGLRRCAAADGGLQPEPVAARQRAAGQRFPGRGLAPCRPVQRRALAHRNAPGSAPRLARALAGRRTRLPGGRTHPHGKLIQIHARRLPGLLERAGYRDVRHWSDTRGWFSVFLAHA